MKSLFIKPLVLMSLVSSPSWALSLEDLVEQAGLWYEKFTSTPFTGEVNEGRYKGSIKNGKKEGSWKYYYENGQLSAKGIFENGKSDGYWEFYTIDGTPMEFFTGTYKNGVKVSD